MTTQRIVLILAAIAALTAAGCGGSSSSGSSATTTASNGGVLVGAGSSLVAPLAAQWAGDYSKKKHVTVAYSPIGSGGGIAQVAARTVDFGGSDAPLSPDQTAAAKPVLQLPWALAATLMAYNVPGVSGHLKLTGPVLAGIFLGKVTMWNDPSIAKVNPGASLPALKIATVHRSDGSGDTFVFTDYLSQISPQWKSKVGNAPDVSWPNGVGSKGNSGVAATILQTKGAIGYVAIGQVMGAHLPYALIRNGAGAYPDPASPAALAAAAAAAKFGSDHSASLVNPPASAAGAYPMSTFTYVIIPTDSPKVEAVKQFIRYAITSGQSFATKLLFAPLPARVVTLDKQALNGM